MTIHRIRRQRWQVAAPDSATAFAMRSLLRRTQDSTLLPALAEAFDAVDVGEREVHIPRLHVRLDFASADGLASALPDRLRVAVGQALREALQGGAAGQGAEAPRDIAPAERLVAYLASGRLAWFDAGRESTETLALLAGEAARWTASPEAGWGRLLAVPVADGHGLAEVFFRFLQLLDEPQRALWAQFARRQAAGHGTTIAEALATLGRLHASRSVDHRLRLLALALLWLSVGEDVPAAAAQWPAALAAARTVLGLAGEAEALEWSRIEVVGQLFTQGARGAADLADSPANATVAPEKRPKSKSDDQPAPGLPVAACGLILLHPYLPRLFAGLGWIADDHPVGQPLPPAVLPPAAALLHWLATGRDEPYEFELPLIKVLLGLSPDDPLPVAAGLLDAAMCDEGEALLAAAIAHWPALGQTSIAGLRISFLQRAGLLYPAPDGWLLRPQSETYDLLLDRLPWGISLIRLGWMRGCLHTEWTTA
jgi:hypothetical protein